LDSFFIGFRCGAAFERVGHNQLSDQVQTSTAHSTTPAHPSAPAVRTRVTVHQRAHPLLPQRRLQPAQRAGQLLQQVGALLIRQVQVHVIWARGWGDCVVDHTLFGGSGQGGERQAAVPREGRVRSGWGWQKLPANFGKTERAQSERDSSLLQSRTRTCVMRSSSIWSSASWPPMYRPGLGRVDREEWCQRIGAKAAKQRATAATQRERCPAHSARHRGCRHDAAWYVHTLTYPLPHLQRPWWLLVAGRPVI